jgi:hypothetical protein
VAQRRLNTKNYLVVDVHSMPLSVMIIQGNRMYDWLADCSYDSDTLLRETAGETPAAYSSGHGSWLLI